MNIKETILDKLIKIIINSSLEYGQKQIWCNFIHQVTDREIIPILQTLEDNPNNLNFLTKNLQDKLQAIKTQNKTALDKILKEEKEYLKNCAE